MRIVAGEFKGRKLAGPEGRATRPTSDKVREAIFSMLGPIDDARVLDLFAGTGALGIEALSRGAGKAVLVERDRRMAAVIERNLSTILGAEDERAELVRGDGLRYLAGAEGFDLVFIDPPYSDAEVLGPKLAQALPRVLSDGAVVVTESDRRAPIALDLAAQDVGQIRLFQRVERNYGDTLIRIYGSQ